MTIMSRRVIGVSACALCATLMLTACSGRRRDPAEERVWRARQGTGDLVVAAPWPWELRKEIRYGEGLQMAVEEVNASGGVFGRALRLARYDDRESIDEGGVVAEKIVCDPDVVAVIGHLQSYVTVQAAGVYDRAGVVLLAPTATDPELTRRDYPRVFRVSFTDDTVGQRLAEVAAARGWNRIALCYIRNAYGRNVANAFEARANRLGLTVSARHSYDPSEQAGERTFEQVLNDWKAAEIDALVVAGEVPSAAIFVAQARRKGIALPILGGDAMSTPGLMAIAGAAAEGTIVASFFNPDEPRPAVRAFAAAFQQRYGMPPDAGSALGYDSVHLLAAAMRQARSAVPDDVARALHAFADWPGLTGRFTFDAKGDRIGHSIALSVVRGGRFERFAFPEPAPRPAAAQGRP